MSTRPVRKPPERRTLASSFQRFAEIIPLDAPEVQRTETRRAWYAGAAAMFDLLVGGLDEDAEPTREDLAYVDSLHREIQAFAADIAGGRA